jgi:hypothetical protein
MYLKQLLLKPFLVLKVRVSFLHHFNLPKLEITTELCDPTSPPGCTHVYFIRGDSLLFFSHINTGACVYMKS